MRFNVTLARHDDDTMTSSQETNNELCCDAILATPKADHVRSDGYC